MPVMDGPSFLAAYRRLPEPRAPVVICTAHSDPVGQSVRLGASDYLRKPFLLRDVLAVVGAQTREMARSLRWRDPGTDHPRETHRQEEHPHRGGQAGNPAA